VTGVDATVCPSVHELVDCTAQGVGTFSGMQGREEGTFKTGVLFRRKAGGGGANSLSSSLAPLPVTLFFIFMDEGAGVEVDNGFRDEALGAGVEVMKGLEEVVVRRGVGSPLEEKGKEGLNVSVEEEEGKPPKVGRAEEVAAMVVVAVKAGVAADRVDAALAVGAGVSMVGGGVGTSGALLSIEAAALLLFLGAPLVRGSGE